MHARPSARIRLPALVIFVAVLNEGVTREQECEHLRQLPGQGHLTPADLQGNFLRLRFAGHTMKWERHSEFTRYALVQPLPDRAASWAPPSPRCCRPWWWTPSGCAASPAAPWRR